MDAGLPSRTTMLTGVLEEALRAIVTEEHLRAAAPDDAVAGVQPQLVVEPGSEQELAKVLQLANEARIAVIPRGGGTKLDWGNAPRRADLVLSTARLNRVIEHAWADMTVTVEAGCTIQTLQETLAQHGQRLALDTLWPGRATVGGVLSTNDSGALRLRFGALRDLIIGVTLALPDGTLASSGGKVVKNVAGYDLPKLVTGAFGTLGVITRAVFRLHPVPKATRTVSCLARDVPEAQRFLLAIQDSKLAHSALQVRCVAGAQPQVDVLFEGVEAGLNAQAEQLKSMLAPALLTDPGPVVWKARGELYSAARGSESNCAVAKISVLPAGIGDAIATLANASVTRLRCNTVVQATGIGCVHLEGEPSTIASVFKSLRAEIARTGGSLVVAHRPATMPPLDAWGEPGDTLPLMRAIKQQLDPATTLNPGRFVGGI
jgi:glycolate dehydrogenase FAD-binding subunit